MLYLSSGSGSSIKLGLDLIRTEGGEHRAESIGQRAIRNRSWEAGRRGGREAEKLGGGEAGRQRSLEAWRLGSEEASKLKGQRRKAKG
jgi:hypothetical protein